jgi:membrane fusion protein, multidrug efflux system
VYPRRTTTRIIVISIFVLGLLAGCKSQPVAQMKGGGMAAMIVPVTVAPAESENVPVEIRIVGTVEPSSRVEIKSMVAGEITKVGFTEGQDVKQGDLLVEIDPRPYQQALRQAEAAVERDRAQLRQSEAVLQKDIVQSKNSDIDAQRYEALLKGKLVSEQQRLQYTSTADAAREALAADGAAIDTGRATLTLDQVAIDKAKLDLSYCQIKAPISGRAGNLLVHAGNLIKANDVPLVVINRVAPVFVSFNAPERYLDEIRRLSAIQRLPVHVIPHEKAADKEQGTLTVVDNTVDAQTGTIHLKATFDNAQRLLWPGQFVDVVLQLGSTQNATMIPAQAVQAGQKGQFVYVVKKDETVEARVVSIARTIEDRVLIDKGLNPGETVVTDGQMMLFPGAHVKAVPAAKGQATGL